jgi:small-conductance mechanosensitive channel
MKRHLLPEEHELALKRAEIERLGTLLAQRECELTNYRVELQEFEQRYLSQVGVRYAELDALDARLRSLQHPESLPDPQVQQHAENAEAFAAETRRAAVVATHRSPVPADDREEIKRLFREAAKAMHPDLVVDEDERTRRQRLMGEVNAAYARGDMRRLQAILASWEGRPEMVDGSGAGADLVRTIRQIAQLTARLGHITDEIAALRASDLACLKARVDDAAAVGVDVLTQLAARLDLKIREAADALAAAGKEGR